MDILVTVKHIIDLYDKRSHTDFFLSIYIPSLLGNFQQSTKSQRNLSKYLLYISYEHSIHFKEHLNNKLLEF